MQQNTIYHICRAADWRTARKAGYYTAASQRIEDSFLHFSTRAQLAGTLELFFAGQKDLVLLAVPADRLGKNLKWEKIPDGRIFPHLYSRLDCDLVQEVVNLSLDAHGRHILPWSMTEKNS